MVEIRPATIADESALQRIQADAGRAPLDVAKMLATPNRVIFVAELGGRVGAGAGASVAGELVAWAGTFFHAAADGAAGSGHYLAGVTVAPSMRRRGVAAALTEARLAWIWRRASEAWYFANAANEASIALHERFGFELVAEAPRVHGVTFDGGRGLVFRAARR